MNGENYSPIPKLRGLFSKRGLTVFLTSTFFTARGGAAIFFPVFFLGYNQQNYMKHCARVTHVKYNQKPTLRLNTWW